MRSGASTPEDLEALYEDAFVVGDPHALARLFDDGAVLLAGPLGTEARGAAQIARSALALWERGVSYLAGPSQVLQARDTGLVLGGPAINVVRRGGDGGWRYVISILQTPSEREVYR